MGEARARLRGARGSSTMRRKAGVLLAPEWVFKAEPMRGRDHQALHR
jgi:hypothetical protein